MIFPVWVEPWRQIEPCLRVSRIAVPDRIKQTKLKKPGPTIVERDSDDTLFLSWFDKWHVSGTMRSISELLAM